MNNDVYTTFSRQRKLRQEVSAEKSVEVTKVESGAPSLWGDFMLVIATSAAIIAIGVLLKIGWELA